MPDLLLLTVGTGTAGTHSSLANGLRATIDLLQPRLFWLAPSASGDSRANADLVREGSDRFAQASASDSYFTLSNHDDLEQCRQQLRLALRTIRGELRNSERLILNPTSGTKQMTAAAVIAALDEGIGDIVFTVGQRADGVVMTGTEKIVSFDAGAYFRERDMRVAGDFFEKGDFLAAAQILAKHASAVPQAHATAMLCHHWRRADYSAAVKTASRCSEDLRRILQRRSLAAANRLPCIEILSDLVAWASHDHRLRDFESALAGAYKALEYAARLAFYEETKLILPCQERELVRCRLSPEWLERAAKNVRDTGEVAPGLAMVMKALQEFQHPLGERFSRDATLRRLTYVRNDSVHDLRPVEENEAASMIDRVKSALIEAFPSMPICPIPSSILNR